MNEEYQRGTDLEWIKHSNQELARLVKRKSRQAGRARFVCLLLLVALGWVVFKFSKVSPIEELWRWGL